MEGQRGFTLIELMITVAIAAIIVAVALPNYSRYMVRSHRSAAQAFLLEVQQKETQYFYDRRAYTADWSTSGDNPLGMVAPAEVSDRYTITVDLVAGTPPGFIARATPKTDKSQKDDGELTINNAGVKEPAEKW
jgi:type IV pilus assembly protein PilE